MRDAAGVLAGVAMRTAPFPPYPLFVLPMPDDAARALARRCTPVVRRSAAPTGAAGGAGVRRGDRAADRRRRAAVARAHPAVRARRAGRAARRSPGRLRPAHADDVELALAWFQAFARRRRRAGRPDRRAPRRWRAPPDEDMLERIEPGRVWLWDDEAGGPVHLTGVNPPASASPGSARSTRRGSTAGAATPAPPWPRCRAGCSPRAPGSACSPTRPTRRRTGSTRRSATAGGRHGEPDVVRGRESARL